MIIIFDLIIYYVDQTLKNKSLLIFFIKLTYFKIQMLYEDLHISLEM